MKKYLGIDLGGTQARVAVVDEEGTIYQMESAPSLSLESSEVIVNNLFSLIDKIDNLEQVSGIGVGVPGPVDQDKGWMNLASNIPAMTKVPLVSMLKERYHLPVYMDNDANVAALAEATVGVGKGKPIVIYVTHSTGIGAGIVVNGQAVSGQHGFAGEVANLIVNDHYPKVNHLNAGSLENVAAGVGFVLQAQKRIDPKIESGKDIFDYYEQNHPEAIKLVDEMSFHFAKGLSMIAAVLDPHCIIIGGGITKSKHLYFDKLREYYNSMVHDSLRDVRFEQPILEEPGIVGAAMLPRSHGE